MPTDANDTLLPFALPSIGKKKVTAAFDAGQASCDGGVLLLAGADKRLGLIDMLAALIPDHCDPSRITHTMSDILRPRIFAIGCGYPDADDLDDLRTDPASSWLAGGCRRAAMTSPRTLVWLFHQLRWRNLVWGSFCQVVIFHLPSCGGCARYLKWRGGKAGGRLSLFNRRSLGKSFFRTMRPQRHRPSIVPVTRPGYPIARTTTWRWCRATLDVTMG